MDGRPASCRPGLNIRSRTLDWSWRRVPPPWRRAPALAQNPSSSPSVSSGSAALILYGMANLLVQPTDLLQSPFRRSLISFSSFRSSSSGDRRIAPGGAAPFLHQPFQIKGLVQAHHASALGRWLLFHPFTRHAASRKLAPPRRLHSALFPRPISPASSGCRPVSSPPSSISPSFSGQSAGRPFRRRNRRISPSACPAIGLQRLAVGARLQLVQAGHHSFSSCSPWPRA